MPIHRTAIVDPAAEIDPSATLGPYVVIEGPVRIGPRTRVMAGAYLTGDTRIGADNVVHPGAALGDEPQDLAYRGAPTGVTIGDRNVFREHAEVQRGTAEGTRTEIGNDGYFMSQAHVGHNSRVGDRVVMATGAMLGGHVVLGDGVFVGGGCAVHQRVRVGRLAFMRGLSRASRDLPPFAMIDFIDTVRGLNVVGLRRAGFDATRLRPLARAFRILFRVRRNLSAAIAEVEATVSSPDVDELLAFLRAPGRGIAMGPRRGGRAPETESDGA